MRHDDLESGVEMGMVGQNLVRIDPRGLAKEKKSILMFFPSHWKGRHESEGGWPIFHLDVYFKTLLCCLKSVCIRFLLAPPFFSVLKSSIVRHEGLLADGGARCYLR